MSGHPARKPEWVLTQNSFDQLLACLDTDRERAGEKYENMRRGLVKFFEWRGSDHPEDYADEAINRVARKLEQGEQIRDLHSYIIGVARMLYKEILRQQKQQSEAIKQLPLPEQIVEDQDELDTRLHCIEECLNRLPAESYQLIMAYYHSEKQAKIDKRKEIAEQLGISLNTLRVRAHRLRAQLEECVAACAKKMSGGM